jgi:membrane-associated phospholipid phosphatase
MTAAESRPWGSALLRLTLLGPFFFLSYGFANWVTSQRTYVPAFVFGWERNIPFLSWTIVPYWSTDLMYAASFFVCASLAELNRHTARLLAAQLISVTAFLLFPLRFTFARPESAGIFAWMFALLGSFDKPFNQAPSLHLSITTILWFQCSAHLTGLALWLCRAWLILVGLSTLTTYQHHFIDLPTGILVGLISVWLFPEFQDTREAGRMRICAVYLTGSLLFASGAMWNGGVAWLLLWPAVALLIVSAAYGLDNPGILAKRRGSIHPAVLVLTAPYTLSAWVHSRLRTRQDPACEVAGGVWIGHLPGRAECYRAGFRSLVDLTAELPARVIGTNYLGIPMLDLVVPNAEELEAAVDAIEAFETERPTLVCCALGITKRNRRFGVAGGNGQKRLGGCRDCPCAESPIQHRAPQSPSKSDP